MSEYEDYNESSDVAEKAGRAQNHVEKVAADIQAGRPTRTTSGKVIAPGNRGAAGHSDTIINILQFAFFIVLIGLSAAAIRQIMQIRDGGNSGPGTGNLDGCFLQADHVYNILIGILVVSAVGAAHTILTTALSGAKKAPTVRFFLSGCQIAYAIVLVVLGCIILGWGSASEQIVQGNSPFQVCGKTDPYKLTFATGAVAVAFGGFILLFVPLLLGVALYNNIVNNPMLVQIKEVLMEEGRRFGSKANDAARRGQGDKPLAEHLVRKGQKNARRGAAAAADEVEDAQDDYSGDNDYSE